MAKLGKALQAAAGNAGAATYVEDVFSTYLYTGNSSTQTITNGVDLAGEGGLVWIKARAIGYDNALFDTNRGTTKWIQSNGTDTETTTSATLTSFNANGFSLGDHFRFNSSTQPMASWTFRKAPKFFDVVTWTGDGTQDHSKIINHSLGSNVGFIAVKGTTNTFNWQCAHRSLATGVVLSLNTTGAAIANDTVRIIDDTSFSVAYNGANELGQSYVAYLFAHDAGGFGDSGEENVISCGSYTGNGSADGPEINLGWEPQWVLWKNANRSDASWVIVDNMRGIVTGGNDPVLITNSSGTEWDGSDYMSLTSMGFKITTTETNTNASGDTHIYIAIRRGPMKTPEDGTSVFTPFQGQSSGGFVAGFPVDMFIAGYQPGGETGYPLVADRLRGVDKVLSTSDTAAEGVGNMSSNFDNMTFVGPTDDQSGKVAWIFRRAPGFFDVVAYTGNNTAGRNINHNLTVVPELMIIKCRDLTEGWAVYHKDIGNNYALSLNSTANAQSSTLWYNTTPTSSVFTLTTDNQVNADGTPYGGTEHYYVAYLFASCPGVSKVGSYTGNGTGQDIDCGFSNGARFVLIKGTDGAFNWPWVVFDTERGIVSGNDPVLLLNSTDAENTGFDFVDPYSAGFSVTGLGNVNYSGVKYIYLAIA